MYHKISPRLCQPTSHRRCKKRKEESFPQEQLSPDVIGNWENINSHRNLTIQLALKILDDTESSVTSAAEIGEKHFKIILDLSKNNTKKSLDLFFKWPNLQQRRSNDNDKFMFNFLEQLHEKVKEYDNMLVSRVAFCAKSPSPWASSDTTLYFSERHKAK